MAPKAKRKTYDTIEVWVHDEWAYQVVPFDPIQGWLVTFPGPSGIEFTEKAAANAGAAAAAAFLSIHDEYPRARVQIIKQTIINKEEPS